MAETTQTTPKKPAPYGEPAAPRPAPEGARLVKLKIDGREIEVPQGTNLIEAARLHGIDIPYYCYHPGLTPAGNCRMCLVEASNSKKPITACTTPITDGLEILTGTESVKKARAGVLELMLINHPLDCPICDKAGECMLQDHTFEHGKDRSRMVEPKELKPTKDLGKDVYIWGNRCIVCTRCVRFCDEVAGTGELCVVQRGDHSVVDTFAGYPLQNNLSGNVVDICPVGALISKDFLYSARVWYQKKTDSICTGCSRGCNIEVQTKDNKVRRLVARHNPHVNGHWICDHGRFDIDHVLGERRCLRYQLGASSLPAGARAESPADAGKALLAALQGFAAGHGAGALGILASAFLTLEETFLLKRLAAALGVPPANLAALARPAGQEEVFKGGFRIAADKNPNRSGVRRLLGPAAFEAAPALIQRLARRELRGLLVFSDRPHCVLGQGDGEADLASALPGLDLVAVFQLEHGADLPATALVLPSTSFAEKDGTLVNDTGRVQRQRPATELPRGIRAEIDLLQELLRGLGAWDRQVPAAGVFRELAGELGLGGATYREVGDLGLQLPEGV